MAKKIYVGNLPWSTTSASLESLFSTYGTVRSAEVIADRDTGAPRARAVMKPGDVAAMPADIRHQGFAPKRSMLLVWENADASLPELYAKKKLKPNPIDF